ncbi:hypothetical protein A1O7_09619 [Cladophialophora yegresii CBS 114405]|uniref:Uncharacterized protein n=1 Tax=Cladophialophora yegresii CBS 114405 TaxID=1182544 RepID=W9VQ61_9EURO|nr:uncharacterized protein A1O7_09619 [Cladophialophora yegresii CBS 114405]EXJ54281.1 hypothetical protein A1O7_09619 [Cladophialophora yegresii CBS 114405]
MFRLASALPSFRGSNSGTDCHAKASAEEQDRMPPLNTDTPASTNRETTPVQCIPPWVRELNNSRVTRHSRASSIVSTQSKFTTTTLQDDARSIDINVGGQLFRISRDGSKVTADAPPPYSGPAEVVRFRGQRSNEAGRFDEDDGEGDEPEDGAVTPRSTFVTLDTDRGVRANVLDPTEFEMPSPLEHDNVSHQSFPVTLVQPPQAQARRGASLEGTSTLQHAMLESSSPRRTNGVRLPRLITSSDIPRATHRPRRSQNVCSPGHPLQVRSAGAILGEQPARREPTSPDYIGRNAPGAFPFPVRAVTTQHATAIRNRYPSIDKASTSESDTAREESGTPLAMDDENDISLHYARMIRTLDAAHRKALLVKDKQVAELREKLNEKDIVLRQQLRAKDFIIDDLKKRLSNLEDNVEIMLEKARYQVEDLWEARWKDRDFHLRERMRRMEEDA